MTVSLMWPWALTLPPQGAFGSDHHRIGGDRESADAEPIEMGLPRRLVGKMLGLVLGPTAG